MAREVFVTRALQGAAVQADVKELEGSAAVIRAVADDPLGIGVVALSAKATGVRVVPLKSPEGTEYTRDDILSLAHPLAWQIHLPFRLVRRETLDPVLHEFFTLILSRDGQSIVADAGYVPISGPMARKQTKFLK
jgi:phosphate transport system substrate-binding protein